MKIAYVTTYDATKISYWSGLSFYIAKSLTEQSFQLELINTASNKYSPLKILLKSKEYLYKYLLDKRYLYKREPILAKSYANEAYRKLKIIKPDIVFSPGTIPIAYLECSYPIVFWTDATFAGLINFYPAYSKLSFSNLCQETIDGGHAIEQAALNNCALAIYSSEWAAQTAIDNYQVNPAKVKVVPFGANIECHRTSDDIKNLINSRDSKKCKLLFIGVDWLRKGGNIVFEIAKELNKSGLETELTVVGCIPMIDKPLPNFVTSLGFISKSTKEFSQKLNHLIAESHFLILPSRADCTPVVFCEANSFGVPCLATKIGGIATIIKNDINGKLFEQNAKISEYCQYISNLFTCYSEYKKLAMSSFQEYQLRLNWSVAGQTIKQMLLEMLLDIK